MTTSSHLLVPRDGQILLLDEVDTSFRRSARDVVDAEIGPQAIGIDRSDDFPTALVDRLGRTSWLGLLVPAEYGGRAASSLQYALALEEIARGSASVAVIVIAHSSLACATIALFGSDGQRRRYLPELATGRALGAYALTESQAGSDAASIRMRARRDGETYVLDGVKAYVTNGDVARTIVTYANVDGAPAGRGITAFVVDAVTDGLTVGPRQGKMGLRGSTTVDLTFDACRVPLSARLGAEGDGFRIAMRVADFSRIAIAAQAVGIAQAALDTGVVYAERRKQFGRAIGTFEAIRWMLADGSVRLHAARLLTHHAAKLRDGGHDFGVAAASAKLFASETAMFCADKAIQIHGAFGYSSDSGVERLLRDAKATEIYSGTSEVQRLVISRDLLRGIGEAL